MKVALYTSNHKDFNSLVIMCFSFYISIGKYICDICFVDVCACFVNIIDRFFCMWTNWFDCNFTDVFQTNTYHSKLNFEIFFTTTTNFLKLSFVFLSTDFLWLFFQMEESMQMKRCTLFISLSVVQK